MRHTTSRSTLAAAALFSLLFAAPADAAFLSRFHSTATLLPDGDVLVIGGQTGQDGGTATNAVQRIQERNLSNVVNELALSVARTSHTATLLPNGDILIAGGQNSAAAGNLALATYEIYSPKLNCASATAPLFTARRAHTATLLDSANGAGKVLLCGGFDNNGNVTNTCEQYQFGAPLAACFAAAPGALTNGPNMSIARAGHTATLITDYSSAQNSRVWIAGGVGIPCAANCSLSPYIPNTETFSPAANTFVGSAPLIQGRAFHTATRMGDGHVLVAGGFNGQDQLASRGFLSSVENYDPSTDSMFAEAPMQERKMGHTATLNVDGKLYVYGGLGNVTTSFFKASGLTKASPNPGPDSFIRTTAASAVLTPTARAAIVAGPASSINLEQKAQITGQPTGMIDNGEILYSTPSVAFPLGVAYLTPGTANPAVGLRADLTDTQVYCQPPPRLIQGGPSGDCGEFDRTYSLNSIAGTVIFLPNSITPTGQTVAAGSAINFNGGPLSQANPGPLTLTGTLTDVVNTAAGTVIKFPTNYVGANITSGYMLLSALTLTQPSSFTITFTQAYSDIPAATPIVAASGGGAQATVATDWKYFQGSIAFTGTTGESFATPVAPPYPGAQANLSGGQGTAVFTADFVDVAGQQFTVDVATIIVEDMFFGDQEDYTPAGGAPNSWAFHWRGLAWSAYGNVLLSPNGDFNTIGGAACGYNLVAPFFCADGTGLSPFPGFYSSGFSPQMAAWGSDTAALKTPRANHTSTVAPTVGDRGSFLNVGGTNGYNTLNTAEILDPDDDTMTPLPNVMHTSRDLHTATLLVDGRILVVGGYTTDGSTSTTPGVAGSTGTTPSVEEFYPNTQTFAVRESLSVPRENHAAVLLGDGRVMVSGGYSNGIYLDSIELYDPISGHWTRGAHMSRARALHQATLLQDGRVLVTMGISTFGVLGQTPGDDEIYNPQTDAWSNAALLPAGPYGTLYAHRCVLLFDGRVLLTGGNNGSLETNASFLYDPVANSWTNTASLPETGMQIGRFKHTALLLPNGNVMVAGGAQAGTNNALPSVETFDLVTSSWQLAGVMSNPHAGHTTVLSRKSFVNNGGKQPHANLWTIGGSGNVLLSQPITFAQTGVDSVLFNGPQDFDSVSYPSGVRMAPTGAGTGIPDAGGDTGTSAAPLPLLDENFFDRGSTLTLTGVPMTGKSEANGGNAQGGNSQYMPRVVVKQADQGGNGAASQGGGGFGLDLTRFIYQSYSGVASNQWNQIASSITIPLPGYNGPIPAPPGDFMPYGWYNIWVLTSGLVSDGAIFQLGPALPGALASPPQPVAGSITSNSISWTWGAAPGALGYDVYSSTSGIFISTSNTTAFTTNNLIPNATGGIIVGGFNISGDGPLSNSATVYTLAAAPTNLSVTSVTFNSAIVQWNTANNSPGTIYEVSASTDWPTANGRNPFTTSFSTPIPTSVADTTNFALINFLLPDTTYSFRVQAYNGNGVATGFTMIVTTMTRQFVNGVVGNALDTTRIFWQWSNTTPPLNPLNGEFFKVYNATSGAVITTTQVPDYLDVVGTTNTPRVILVSAVTTAGEGPLTGGPTVFTLAAPPAVLSPSILNLSTGSFTVVWGSNGDPAYTLFAIGVSGSQKFGSTTTVLGNALGVSGANSAGEAFAVDGFAYNGNNTLLGIPSPVVSFGTAYTLANPPVGLGIVGETPTSITLSWGTNNNSPKIPYEVTYTTDNFVTSVIVGSTFTAGVTTVTVSGLVTGTTYTFRVQAENQAIPPILTGFSNYITTAPANGGALPGQLSGVVQAGQNTMIQGDVGFLPPEYVNLYVPVGTMPPGTIITISTIPASAQTCTGGLNVGVQILTNPPGLEPTGPLYLTVGFTPAQIAGQNPAVLNLERVNETNQCVPLVTTLDTLNNLAIAQINHLSTFQLATVLGSGSPDNTVIFPNPFYPGRGQGYVTFQRMPPYAHVRIFTVRGELVNEFYANGSGLLIWGGINQNGRSVASGVYLAVVESGDAKRIFKVVVLR